MSLSTSEISAVVAELQPLVGSRVDALRVCGERALSLELYGRSGSVVLLVSAEPEVTRLHVTGSRRPSPDRPFALQSQLRREMEGAKLTGIDAAPGDRVVTLRLEKGPASFTLVAELTGRNGNIVLVAADGRIRAAAVRQVSARRRLVPGEPYQAPPPPPLALEPPEPSRFQPLSPSSSAERFPLSAAIDAYYRSLEDQRALAEERRRLRVPLRGALARIRRTLEKLDEDAARIPAAEADRRAGDLIKANLPRLRRGASEAQVVEYTAEGPRQILLRLDPALGPRENMERYYRRCRRIVESATRVAERAQEMRSREQALTDLLRAVDVAAIDEVPRIEREARRLGAGPRAAAAARRKHPDRIPPFRQFRSLTGAVILAGRGAAENDALTVQFARGNDLWLHVRERPGAHVILRLEKGQGPDQESLLDAAHVAVHFSDARGETAPEVVYTRVKYVRKPRGAGPGAVLYSQERALVLRVEPPRLERLLAAESGESS